MSTKSNIKIEQVRNKLQKILSRDIIAFQSRRLLYTQLAEFISSQIRLIEDIEGICY